MNNPTPSCYKKTSIGGQAVIEGIMMRGPVKSAMANRLPDGTLDLEEWETYPHGIAWYNRHPLDPGLLQLCGDAGHRLPLPDDLRREGRF